MPRQRPRQTPLSVVEFHTCRADAWSCRSLSPNLLPDMSILLIVSWNRWTSVFTFDRSVSRFQPVIR
ncbi:hypothetical protein [Streptomyces sp. NPDC054940]